MELINLGIMQSRLVNPKGRGIQFEPNLKEVESEFRSACNLGLNHIEWIITSEDNLFFNGYETFNHISNIIDDTGVVIDAVCLDYLMDCDFNYAQDYKFFDYICSIAISLGCNKIVLPVYKKNLPIYNKKFKHLIDLLYKEDFRFLFEFLDMKSKDGIQFLYDLSYEVPASIEICFDIGNNCDGSFNNLISELKAYHSAFLIGHIHIKEKDKNGNSCKLGGGIIGKKGWNKIFDILYSVGDTDKNKYGGNFTLQVQRGTEGAELETILEQAEFIYEIMGDINIK